MRVLSLRWFPTIEPTEDSMAEAIWLENSYWERHSVAVANGIAKAFKGK
ncbi:hypothetical protein [uncultured Amphritea sp.]|nr:hypothetical protein [uncultured Amphritea sp.]